MRPRPITLVIGLSLTACTQAGAANEGQLGELNDQLEDVTARLNAIEDKLELAESERATILEAAREARRGPPPPPPPAAPAVGSDDLAAGIRCAKDDHCTIERTLIDDLLANPASLARSARIVPAVQEGETRGFKLYGLRPGSFPKLLHFENGDTLMSINGKPLDTVESAMASYTELRDAKELKVGFERKGESKTLTIEIK